MSTKRIVSLILILIPVVAFAESLVYVAKTPTPAVNKMQGPSAYVEVAGVDVGLTTDYRGMTVPTGSAPDIGAYEFGPGDPGYGRAYRGRMGIHWLW